MRTEQLGSCKKNDEGPCNNDEGPCNNDDEGPCNTEGTSNRWIVAGQWAHNQVEGRTTRWKGSYAFLRVSFEERYE